MYVRVHQAGVDFIREHTDPQALASAGCFQTLPTASLRVLLLQAAAEALVKAALDKGSADNLTAVVVQLWGWGLAGATGTAGGGVSS